MHFLSHKRESLDQFLAFDRIIFLQDGCEEAEMAFEILNYNGEQSALEYLRAWDYGERSDIWDVYKMRKKIGDPLALPFGTEDCIHIDKDYILSYHRRIGYIALSRGIREEEYAELIS